MLTGTPASCAHVFRCCAPPIHTSESKRAIMADDSARQRLQVLAGQLDVLSRAECKGSSEPAEDLVASEDAYAVALPEKLTPEGEWTVYRQVTGEGAARAVSF